MEQKYRLLEVGELTQQGDECLVSQNGWVEVIVWSALVDDYCFGRYRRPIPEEESIDEVMEMRKQRDCAMRDGVRNLEKLIDARRQITDLTRRLEDALSEKVIAEKQLKNFERHVEEQHVAGWAKIQEVLPESSEDSRSSLVDDILGHIRNLERSRDNWREVAAQYSRNQELYHGLVTDIGNMFGLRARISDDGTICEDVILSRVPELVGELIIKNS